MDIKKIKVIALAENVFNNSTPNRLRLSLQNSLVDFKILTRCKNVDTDSVILVQESIRTKINHKIDYIVKKIIKNYYITTGMPFTIEHTGIDVSHREEIQNADIIQLHWLGSYFLSANEIKKIVKLNKPVVVVCHDNGHFTGGCHVRMGCEGFKSECGKCPQLHSNIRKDWSYYGLKAKKKAFRTGNIVVVSPSHWMDKNVEESVVFKGFKHCIIPNSVNTDIFRRINRDLLKEKYNIENKHKIILFGAVSAVSVPYKGYSYLLKALELLEERMDCENIKVIVFGSDKGEFEISGNILIEYWGKLNEVQMAEVYNLADVYVVPSLEDSFNNTVIESMACETPVVAFATGGIKDIIVHKETGYLAKYKDTSDLVEGIKWVLQNDNASMIGSKAKERVAQKYTREIISEKYIALYKDLLK